MRVSKDRIDMDDKTLQKPVLKDYGETVVTADSGSSYTIDLTEGARITTSSDQSVNIIITDVQGSNGVVHAVDQVLLP